VYKARWRIFSADTAGDGNGDDETQRPRGGGGAWWALT
jgi:hypothetical protein